MYPAINTEKKALEMTMRDVMDNLEDTSSYLALTCPEDLEILSIEAPELEDPFTNNNVAELHLHPTLIEKKSA